MKENDIDRLFREAFHEAEQTPSKHVWRQIEKQLEKEDKIKKIPSKGKFWIISAAAAIIIFTAGLGLFKIYYSNQTEVGYANVTITQGPDSKSIDSTKTENTAPMQKNTIEKFENENKTLAVITPPSQSRMNTKKPMFKNDRSTEKLGLLELAEVKPYIASIEISSEKVIPHAPIRQVTEVEDIKPLIEPEEETESMLAQARSTVPSNNKNIVTSILNTISENIEVSDSKEIRFRADEEGSLRIDILNSLVKNRNKKRK